MEYKRLNVIVEILNIGIGAGDLFIERKMFLKEEQNKQNRIEYDHFIFYNIVTILRFIKYIYIYLISYICVNKLCV